VWRGFFIVPILSNISGGSVTFVSRKRIVILGSTGSIGTQALDIVRRLPDRFEVLGLAANSNTKLLAEQANEFKVRFVSIGSESLLGDLRAQVGNVATYCGVEGMCTLSTLEEADLIVVAVAGAIGIAPTHAALEVGKEIALASKEVLVAAGETTMRLAKERGCAILPIDSEHSAIFQCLQGAPPKSVERILLTASGGPFRKVAKEELEKVTPEQALKHPTWNMGGLVTINSATLMNKALETIEARWLFDVPIEEVEVVVHPQSIIHSMVRFNDGSTLAQLGLPDMRLPIQYAMVYPERVQTELPRMELKDYANLIFEAPDEEKFPALGLARRAVQQGGTIPAVMNAANEVAVARFLGREIGFLDIMRTVDRVMESHTVLPPTFENVLEADRWAREKARHI
jgi:1-deoxy-D-xylulose-5-phosphate reductoisomerase